MSNSEVTRPSEVEPSNDAVQGSPRASRDTPSAVVLAADHQLPSAAGARSLELMRPEASPGASATIAHTQLIPAPTPRERVQLAADVATELHNVIVAQGLRTKVGSAKKLDRRTGQPVKDSQGRDVWEPKWHPNVEAWQTLATLLGVAIVEAPKGPEPLRDPVSGEPIRRRFTLRETLGKGDKQRTLEYEIDGYDWRCAYDIIKDGAVLASASGVCSRTEAKWARSDEHAVIGMAQTRGQARAMKTAAAWMMALAGYSTTPAEEMDGVEQPGPDTGQVPAPVTAWWTQEATRTQKAQARAALGYLLDPGAVYGDEDPAIEAAGGADRVATQVLLGLRGELGLVPAAAALALVRAGEQLQHVLATPANREPAKTQPNGGHTAPPANGSRPTPPSPPDTAARPADTTTVDFAGYGPEDGSGHSW
jgi:hypothetical protein